MTNGPDAIQHALDLLDSPKRQRKLSRVVFSSEKEDWATPPELFQRLDRIWGFTLDVCANEMNHKVTRYFSPEQDGLEQDWGGYRCWMNPPYGRGVTEKWVRKAHFESLKPGTVVVCLLPVRTGTSWWQKWVIPHAALIKYLPGRVQFEDAENSAPFDSAIVIFGEIA